MTTEAPRAELAVPSQPPAIDIARILRLLVLLAGEGAGIAVFIHGFRARWLRQFVAQNELPPADRDRLIQWILAGAVLPCAAALTFLAVTWRKHGPSGLDAELRRVSLLARVFAPAVFLWAMPQMSTYKAWIGRDSTYLIAAALLVVTFEPTLGVALRAGTALRLPELWRRFTSTWGSAARTVARSVPHVAVGVASSAYIAYMSWFTVLQHWRRQTGGLDLGYFTSFFWNTIHGRPFYCPITHPRAGSYLSIHAEFAVYLLAPIYALWPKPETLLVIQSALLGLSAVPLYLFARRRLANDWLAATVALCFLLYVPLQAPNFTDFHFLTISMFFILWAAYFFETERKVLFWVAVVVSLMCREDVPFGGIGVGLALLFSGRHTKTGAALAFLSLSYLAIVKFVVMPRFGAPSFVYIYERLVASGEGGFAGVVKTLMTNPLYTLSAILLPEKLPYLLHVFMPLAFLPLRRKRYWFLLFPGFFVTLLSTGYMPVIQIRYQYVTHFTPYVFLATVLVLQQIGKTKDSIARYAACGACVLGTYFAAHQFGVLQHGNFFAGIGKVSFDYTAEHRTRLANLREIVATIPKDGTVAATERDCAHVAEREYLFTLKYETQGADFLLYSDDGIDLGQARRIVRETLVSKTHGFHAERPGFVVLRRGAPTDRNPELLARIGFVPAALTYTRRVSSKAWLFCAAVLGCDGRTPPSASTAPTAPVASSSTPTSRLAEASAPAPPASTPPVEPPPPPEPPSVVEVEVGDRKRVFVLRGATGSHAGVFLHGLCGHPRAYLESFLNAAAAYGAFIAPNGDAPCNGAYRSWTGKTEALENQIREGLAQAGVKREPTDVTLVGYSMGGTRALALVRRSPERYTKLILMGTPDTPSPQGLDRVTAAVMMAGSRDRQDKMKAGARAFEKAGIPSTFMALPGAAHGEMGPQAERVMGEALDWVEAHQKRR